MWVLISKTIKLINTINIYMDHSELTVVKNTDGIATALGYPIHSFFLQKNKPLFGGGAEYMNLAVPAGLVCRTETICSRVDNMVEEPVEEEVVPDSLYDKLMLLAETTPPKKMTRRAKHVNAKHVKNKKTNKKPVSKRN
jgi:hypothetical protein